MSTNPTPHWLDIKKPKTKKSRAERKEAFKGNVDSFYEVCKIETVANIKKKIKEAKTSKATNAQVKTLLNASLRGASYAARENLVNYLLTEGANNYTAAFTEVCNAFVNTGEKKEAIPTLVNIGTIMLQKIDNTQAREMEACFKKALETGFTQLLQKMNEINLISS